MISIIMATYNGSKYIEEQLDSILSQSLGEFKLIIIDDCSNDDTVSILERYSRIDKRIFIFENETNLGCSRTFEKGVMLADGDYIALVDQDDVWHPKKLEILISELEHSDLDMVYSSCNLIDGSGKTLSYPWSSITPLFGTDSNNPDVALLAAFNSFVLGCAMIFKAVSLKKCLPFQHESGNHDKWIMNNIAFWGKFKFIDKALFSYRIHENNLSMRFVKSSIRTRLRSAFKTKQPFYNPVAIEHIIQLGEGKGLDVCYYRRLLNSIRKFHSDGLAGRALLVANYYRYMFLRLRGKKRVKEIIKLILNIG